MKKVQLIAIYVFGCLLARCNDKVAKSKKGYVPTYTVVEDSKNEPFNNYRYSIKIPSLYEEKQLKQVSVAVSATHPDAESHLLWFFPDGIENSQGIPYAVVTIDKGDTSINIQGSKSSEIDNMHSEAFKAIPDGQIVGVYNFNVPMMSCYKTIFKRADNLYVKSSYSDGSHDDGELLRKDKSHPDHLQTAQMKQVGEYYKFEDAKLIYYTKDNKPFCSMDEIVKEH